MIFRWNASDSMRKAEAITGGKMQPRERKTPAQFSELDPEQRAAVLGLVKSIDGIETAEIEATSIYSYGPSDPYPVARPIDFDAEPTIADLIATAQRRQASRQEAEAAKEAEAAEKDRKRQAEKAAQAERDARTAEQNAASQATLDTLISTMNSWIDDPETMQATLNDLESFSPTTDEQQKQLREAAKSAWIAMYGSDHLRRATAAGYNSQRRYVTERAAKDAPGWDLDFDDAAAWNDRSDPSPAAMDALTDAERLARTLPRKRYAPSPEIVWLTAPASNEPDRNQRGIDASDFEPCEAVTIRGYLGRYDLIKIVD